MTDKDLKTIADMIVDAITGELESTTKPIMTCKECARFLDVSLSTLYRWTSQKTIPHYKTNNKILFFDKSEIVEWAKSERVETMSERFDRIRKNETRRK